jgi:aspartyl-tRNA(Asn)/glutamyl-tRNA(Gln) amidotransferase subunit A
MTIEGDPTDLGVTASVAAIAVGTLSALELVDACLARIAATDADLLAWVEVDVDGARAQALERDADLAAGRPTGALHGVPVGIKDIIDVAGLPTRAGAPQFAHRTPTADAPAVARLRAAGAVIVGKTQTTQFAYSDPAPTRNPWSVAHTPGGSSSGSAAAVAARQVPAAIGTQTGGSILRPAAYCGVVGFKGPHGAVPLEGIVPLAPSLDHCGSFGRSVDDAVRIWRILADRPATPAQARPAPRAAPRLAVFPELIGRADEPLRTHLASRIDRLRDAGAEVAIVDLGVSVDAVVDAGRVIMAVEAARGHAADFARHADEYAPGIAGLIRTGQAVTFDELAEAERVRSAFRASVGPVLARHDALLSPVALGAAPPLEGGTGDFSHCLPWSVIAVPSMSIPTGLDDAGLPFAVQLTGGADADSVDRLLWAAAWCERIFGFDARPPMEVRTPG